jgi:hypothetical protein
MYKNILLGTLSFLLLALVIPSLLPILDKPIIQALETDIGAEISNILVLLIIFSLVLLATGYQDEETDRVIFAQSTP